ncbi:MAG: hypothetical protein HC919_09540 [Oscillatoriales cyanobacterium SM2_2_1]|nr:hypothetical protein [Oscillatoriales cyanobacterium SM2_2_1]
MPETAVWGEPTCAVQTRERQEKDRWRRAALGDRGAATIYRGWVLRHRQSLERCRQNTWPQVQGVWLRVYPNDWQPGVLEDVLDRIVNRGYNRVFVEVFYDGRVLLPVAKNPTPWRSVLAEAVQAGQVPAEADLWARTVRLARERGLSVYGWSFALNFGYSYGERADRQGVLARNGRGETTVVRSRLDPQQAREGRSFYLELSELEHLFVDPYNPQGRADLTTAVREFLKARPDGMVFDYVRYSRTGVGTDGRRRLIEDLWIFGAASRAVWRSRPNATAWDTVVEHAYQGVVDFVAAVSRPVEQQGVPIGTVFFPEGNRRGLDWVDGRVQPWDRFPAKWERHPMTYALCKDGQCVADQVGEVLRQSTPKTLVCPVLAGTWGQSFRGHASFEQRMRLIREQHPQVRCVSHFVYAWMEPESDRRRKAGLHRGDE